LAGAAIVSVGAACVIRTRRAQDLPLAALPLLLGVHQLVEARIWHMDGGTGAATVTWAVIALPVLAACRWGCGAPPHAGPYAAG
jgi:hypothetical protein